MDPAYIAANAGCIVASIAALVGYHVWLVYTIRRSPARTVYGWNEAGRRAWVVSVMKKKQDILAIQSLRNWIMGSSMLGSTAIVIVFGFVAFFSTVGTRGDSALSTDNPLHNQFGFLADNLFGFKILAILVIYMSSFFAFVNAIRFFNHTGLVLNITCTNEDLDASKIPHPQLNLPIQPPVVAALMNRGAFFHALGIRGYYLSFPLIAYLWGPWSLFACTCIDVALMRFMDLHVHSDLVDPDGANGGGGNGGNGDGTRTAATGGGGAGARVAEVGLDGMRTGFMVGGGLRWRVALGDEKGAQTAGGKVGGGGGAGGIKGGVSTEAMLAGVLEGGNVAAKGGDD